MPPFVLLAVPAWVAPIQDRNRKKERDAPAAEKGGLFDELLDQEQPSKRTSSNRQSFLLGIPACGFFAWAGRLVRSAPC